MHDKNYTLRKKQTQFNINFFLYQLNRNYFFRKTIDRIIKIQTTVVLKLSELKNKLVYCEQ